MKNLSYYIFFTLLFVSTSIFSQNVYVDSLNGNDTNTGNTWITAFKTVAKACKAAHETPAIQTIFVAKGTYFPAYKPFNMGINQIGTEITSPDNRDKTFHLRQGLEVYGGYPNGGGVRDIQNNPTVLSGLLGGTDSAFHVVVMDSASNWVPLNDTTILNGFTIEYGNASIQFSTIGVNGNPIGQGSGGGIIAYFSNNKMENNTIQYNRSSSSGGGIRYVGGINFSNNNSIHHNYSSSSGGGIAVYLGNSDFTHNNIYENSSDGSVGGGIYSYLAKCTIISNSIYKNSSPYYGGGIFANGRNLIKDNFIFENLSNVGSGICVEGDTCFVINNLIVKNSALNGGGIECLSGFNVLSNNTIAHNYSANEGPGFYARGGINSINNNIFWRNNSPTFLQNGSEFFAWYSSGININTFKNNMMQFPEWHYSTSVNVALAAGSSDNLFALDPLFIGGTGLDSLGLSDCSPAIDQGNDALMYTGSMNDIAGFNRLHDVLYATNNGSSISDIGAYENQNINALAAIIPSSFANIQANPVMIYGSSVFTNTAFGSPASANWYDAQTGGNLLKLDDTIFVTPTLNSSATFYAIAALGKCESNLPRTAITDSVLPCPGFTDIYVDSSVAVSGLGDTWGAAFKSLNDALQVAQACPLTERIFVAKGTYIPSLKPFIMDVNKIGTQSNTFFENDKTFHIRSGLEVYGGYPTGGGLRDILNNPTILNGVLGNGDSVKQVVLMDSSANWATANDTSILDGFTVQYAINGGIVSPGGTVLLRNNTIQYNRSATYGGGVYCDGTGILIDNIIRYNKSTNGAGVYVEFISVLQGNTIQGNNATQLGGGIFCYSCKIMNNLIKGNLASSGGGICLQAPYRSISGNTIIQNVATQNGGGIFGQSGTNYIIEDNIIDSNSSVNGAGIYLHSEKRVVKNNVIRHNHATSKGGGIYFYTVTMDADTIAGNIIDSNFSSAGGGIYKLQGLAFILNNQLTNNHATTSGGALFLETGTAKLSNNTIAGNKATYAGGMLWYYTTGEVNNNIFWKNKTLSDTTIGCDYRREMVTFQVNFKNNLMQLPASKYTTTGIGMYDLGSNSSGNIFAANPLFKGGAGSDSLTLGDCSPAIDKGLDSLFYSNLSTDIVGNNRFHDVAYVTNSGSSLIDIGAYENQSIDTSYPFIPFMTGIQANPTSIIGGGSFSNLGLGVGNSVNWYDTPIGGNLVQYNNAQFVTPLINSTTTYYAIAAHGICEAPGPRLPITDTVVTCPSITDLYVDSAISISSNGSSWSQAYKTLSEGLALAHGCPLIEKIHVAKGTYHPLNKPFDIGISLIGNEMSSMDTRDKTFHIRVGLEVYGAYPNGGGIRNLIANPTILDGNLGSGDTSYHVVLIDSSQYWTTPNDTTILDGFTIQHGSADSVSNLLINGQIVKKNNGGGIYMGKGAHFLINNTVSNNYTKANGAGIYTYYGNNIILNNVVSGNKGFEGGGLYLKGGTSKLINNTVTFNSGWGGGVVTDSGTHLFANNIFWGNLTFDLTNTWDADYYSYGSTNTFTNNILQQASSFYSVVPTYWNYLGINPTGNIFHFNPLFKGGPGSDSLSLDHCSPAIDAGIDTISGVNLASDILGNSRLHDVPFAANNGGNIIDIGAYENQSVAVTVPITPSLGGIFATPVSVIGGGFFTNTATGATNSINWYDAPVGGNLINANETIWVSPLLITTTTYYAIAALGNCESTGPRTPIKDSVTPCSNANTIYVDSSVVISGNGSSWVQAFKTLSEGLALAQTCAMINTIKVAKGTYVPDRKPFYLNANLIGIETSTSNIRDKTFHVREGLELYGGYPSGGGARNILINPTILTGLLPSSDTAYHVVYIIKSPNWTVSNDTNVVDGFIIKHGNANGVINWSKSGGGIFAMDMRCKFSNNVIRLNYAKNAGGGAYLYHASSVVSDNTIEDNICNVNGGGLYTDGFIQCNKNTVIHNSASEGGGLYLKTQLYGSKVTNNVIAENTASLTGGGLYTIDLYTIYWNTIVGNNAGINAGGLYIRNYGSLSTELANNIIWRNKANGSFNQQGSDYQKWNSTMTQFYNNIMQLPVSYYVVSGFSNYSLGYELNNLFVTDPMFADSLNIAGPDGINRTSDDGYQLLNSSPAIDSGVNPSGSLSTLYDIRNASRIQNLISDIGAYEKGNCTPASTTSFNFTDSICNGNSYTFNGQTIYGPGIYYDTLSNVVGCDSLIILHLIVNSNTFHADTVTACDAYTWPVNNQTFTSGTIYTFTSLNSSGCIKTDKLYLTIHYSTINPDQTVTANLSYTWPMNNVTYTVSGIYTFTQTGLNGCPDMYSLHLTIVDSSLDVINVHPENSIYFYPNPVADVLNIQLNTKPSNEYAIKVVDVGGRKVKEVRLKGDLGDTIWHIRSDEIANGIYNVQIFENDVLLTKRMITIQN